MSIRKVEIVDLNTVMNITTETIKIIYTNYYPKGAVDFFVQYHNKENIAKDIENGYVFILEIDKIAIGTVTIKENEINRLFILPKYQKRGYGSSLMDFSEKYILDRFKKVRIDASLPAKNIYLSRGYKQVEYHTIMTKTGDYLCYDVMEKTLRKSNIRFNYDGMTFTPLINTENGEVSNLTIFEYHQDENILWGEYFGGDIIRGTLLGSVTKDGQLDFYYNHINNKGEQRIGKCHSVPKVLESGKIELHEEWQWLNGDMSTGSSIIIQK